MFKLLLQTRFDMFFASLTQGKKNKKSASKAGKIGLICLFAFVLLYMLGAMFALFIGLSMAVAGGDQIYAPFALAILASFGLCMVGSIFPTKTQIFDSKDNELLLAMPIEPKYIFTSRLVFLLIINFVLESIIMIPAMIGFGIFIGYTFLGFIFTLLVYLMLPFLSMAISSLIAWIISIIASKLRNKTLITVILFVIFFGAYMLLMSSVGMSESDSLENIDMSGMINAPVVGWGAKAMTYGSIVSFILFALSCAIPALVAYWLLNKSFVKILTTKRGIARVEYKEKAEKAEGVFKTLVKKELRRFFTSSAYIINSGMGIIMSILFTVMIAVVGPDLINELVSVEPTLVAVVPVIAYGVIAFGSSMNMISTPSISLEDKYLWIVQTLPVNPADALLAKVMAHVVICTPGAIICSVILGIALKLSVVNTAMLILSTAAIVVFTAYFGMLLGLHFPKFDWQNENVAVKQGFAVFGSMFGGMIWAMINAAIVFLLTGISFIIGALASVLVNGVVCFIIHRHLTHGGVKTFMTLKQ